MKNRPQTIQIFLPDGDPTSIRESEITNRLVKAILFPRAKIKEVSKRALVHFTGVYFLFGPSEEGLGTMVYIGEGEDCYQRILSHNLKKDWWTHSVVVSVKTNEYTKTDGKFLEYYCINEAEKNSRFSLENSIQPNKPSISESREYDLLDNFETLKLLLSTLGYSLFEENKRSRSSKDVFYCRGKEATAQGEMRNDGFRVYAGSIFQGDETNSFGSRMSNHRKVLVEKGVLEPHNGHLILSKDYTFTSPSAAAAYILGRRANGWTSWRNKEGKTLDEMKRK